MEKVQTKGKALFFLIRYHSNWPVLMHPGIVMRKGRKVFTEHSNELISGKGSRSLPLVDLTKFSSSIYP